MPRPWAGPQAPNLRDRSPIPEVRSPRSDPRGPCSGFRSDIKVTQRTRFVNRLTNNPNRETNNAASWPSGRRTRSPIPWQGPRQIGSLPALRASPASADAPRPTRPACGCKGHVSRKYLRVFLNGFNCLIKMLKFAYCLRPRGPDE